MLALRSGIAPDVWRRQTDEDIATAIHLLYQRDHTDTPDPPDAGPQMSG